MKIAHLSFGLTLALLVLQARGWTTMPTPKISNQVKHAVTAGLTVGCGCIFFATANTAHAADVAAGSRLFEATCTSCHAGGQNLIAKEKTLDKETLERYVGTDPSDIQQYMRYSFLHRGAHLFGGNLSEKDFENVVAYVLDQALGNKW
jgi:cytochrome c6